MLYFGGRKLGESVDSSPKTNSPLTIGGQELLKGSFRGAQAEGGATGRNSTVSSDSHLETGPAVV